MTQYREILRLASLGFRQQNIADSCNVSKKTVSRVLKRAKELVFRQFRATLQIGITAKAVFIRREDIIYGQGKTNPAAIR